MEDFNNFKQLIGKLDKIIQKESIVSRVSDNQPLNTHIGYINGVYYDINNDKLKVLEKEIKAESIEIDTLYTIESLYDMKKLYKEDLFDLLSFHIKDLLNYKLDKKFIDMITNRAKTIKKYTANNNDELFKIGQSIAIKINKGLCDLPISDNRSPQGWAIVSSNIASILSVTVNFDNQQNNDNSPSYLGKISNVDYYIDYTHDNTLNDKVIFGIKGNGFTRGSTINSTYNLSFRSVLNNKSGQEKLILLYRGKQSINPIDDIYEESAFLGQFDVDLNSLDIIN